MRAPMKVVILLWAAVLLAGCRNHVTITSEPSGARVWIDNAYQGNTPLTAVVTWWAIRKNTIMLEHPDCHRFYTVMRRQPYYGYLLLDLLTPYYSGALFNSMGPVPHQHFVLRRKAAKGAGAGAKTPPPAIPDPLAPVLPPPGR